jgi:hypothetical protein
MCLFRLYLSHNFAPTLNLNRLVLQPKQGGAKFIAMKLIIIQWVKKILRQTVAFSLLLSFSIYAWARILFYEVPFTVQEDIPILIKTVLLCWGMVLALSLAFNGIVKIGEWIQQPKTSMNFNKKWILTAAVILFMSAFLFSCNA